MTKWFYRLLALYMFFSGAYQHSKGADGTYSVVCGIATLELYRAIKNRD